MGVDLEYGWRCDVEVESFERVPVPPLRDDHLTIAVVNVAGQRRAAADGVEPDGSPLR